MDMDSQTSQQQKLLSSSFHPSVRNFSRWIVSRSALGRILRQSNGRRCEMHRYEFLSIFFLIAALSLNCASFLPSSHLLSSRQTVSEDLMARSELVDKDKLVLRGLQFHGFHGVKAEEKKLGQKFVIDVDAWMDLSAAGVSDDIADTVSYTDIYRIAKGIVEGPSQNLLESVAHLIANTTLLKFPQISAVRVEVKKPHVAVHGTIDYLGVEIFRYKKVEK